MRSGTHAFAGRTRENRTPYMDGWERGALPLSYRMADHRLVANEALAVFKRPFRLQTIRAGWTTP